MQISSDSLRGDMSDEISDEVNGEMSGPRVRTRADMEPKMFDITEYTRMHDG